MAGGGLASLHDRRIAAPDAIPVATHFEGLFFCRAAKPGLERACACMPPALCGVLARLSEAGGSMRLCGPVGRQQAGQRVASLQRLRSKMEADMHVHMHRSTMRGSSRGLRMSDA